MSNDANGDMSVRVELVSSAEFLVMQRQGDTSLATRGITSWLRNDNEMQVAGCFHCDAEVSEFPDVFLVAQQIPADGQTWMIVAACPRCAGRPDLKHLAVDYLREYIWPDFKKSPTERPS